jgi:phenylacetate-CoA ligase
MFDVVTIVKGGIYVLTKRYSGRFGQYWRQIMESQWYDEERLRQLQDQALRQLVAYCDAHVPYYAELFREIGLCPEDVRTVDDLRMIPLLEKDTLRAQGELFVSRTKKRWLLRKAHTSGTTGKPLTVYRDLDNVVYEYATLQRQWLWGGLRHNDRLATLKGEKRVPADRNKPPFWRSSPSERKLVMSSYHLSRRNAEAYIAALRRFKPVGLEGYPSSVYALARFMAEQGLTIPLKAVFTTSETLEPRQRELIEEVFGCKVFDYYGQAERVVAIHTCEHGSYHVLPEYGIAEFLPVPGVDQRDVYELVGTGLHNLAMPLLRYRIGDTVELSREKCPCGRAYPTAKAIVGRRDNYLVTPSGALIGRLDHVFKGARHIVEAQMVQEVVDRVEVRIVPDSRFDSSDAEFVRRKLQERVGSRMQVTIKVVDRIPRSKTGKFRAVVSKVRS